MFWADIARFLQYFRNLSNSFMNILAILQDFNGIFSKILSILRCYVRWMRQFFFFSNSCWCFLRYKEIFFTVKFNFKLLSFILCTKDLTISFQSDRLGTKAPWSVQTLVLWIFCSESLPLTKSMASKRDGSETWSFHCYASWFYHIPVIIGYHKSYYQLTKSFSKWERRK